eukprot:7111887-Lingulodinium_polyedra.AAC.1
MVVGVGVNAEDLVVCPTRLTLHILLTGLRVWTAIASHPLEQLVGPLCQGGIDKVQVEVRYTMMSARCRGPRK